MPIFRRFKCVLMILLEILPLTEFIVLSGLIIWCIGSKSTNHSKFLCLALGACYLTYWGACLSYVYIQVYVNVNKERNAFRPSLGKEVLLGQVCVIVGYAIYSAIIFWPKL